MHLQQSSMGSLLWLWHTLQSILSLLYIGNVMNKVCVCGKTLPYETEQDQFFFDKYHSNCTDDVSDLDFPLVY
jgi:hypothetical protein